MSMTPTSTLSLDDDLRTPLSHAECPGGSGGLAFYLGDSLVFAPWHAPAALARVPQPTLRTLTAPVPHDMAVHATRDQIEPRLAHLRAPRRARL